MEETKLPPIDGDSGGNSRGSRLRNWLSENKNTFKKLKEKQYQQQQKYGTRPWSDVDDWSEYDSGLPDSPDSAAFTYGRNGRGLLEKRSSIDTLVKFPAIVQEAARDNSSESSLRMGSAASTGMLDRYSLSPRPLMKHRMGHDKVMHDTLPKSRHKSRFTANRKHAIGKLKHLVHEQWAIKEDAEEKTAGGSKPHKHQSSSQGRGTAARNDSYVSKALGSLHEKQYLTEWNNAFSLIKTKEMMKEWEEETDSDTESAEAPVVEIKEKKTNKKKSDTNGIPPIPKEKKMKVRAGGTSGESKELEDQASVMVDSSLKDREQIQKLRQAEMEKWNVKLKEKLNRIRRDTKHRADEDNSSEMG